MSPNSKDDMTASETTSVSLVRTLTQLDLILFGLIIIAPIAPFTVFGEVSAVSNGTAAGAFLIGMLAIMMCVFSYSEMSAASNNAGSTYSYIRIGLGPFIGFLGGWLITLDYILVPGLVGILTATACRYVVPSFSIDACVIAFVALSTAINLGGIKLTTWVNKLVILLVIVALATFFVTGIWTLIIATGTGFTMRPLFHRQTFGFSTIFQSVSIATLCFLGFDGVSTLSEETRSKAQDVGSAMIIAVLVTGILFVAQAWLAEDLSMGRPPQDQATAFYEIAEYAGGPALKWLVVLAILAVGISSTAAAQVGLSRILFAMARDSLFPRIFGLLHPRSRSPAYGSILIGLLSLVIGLAFSSQVTTLIFLVNIGALSSYILVNAAVVNHYVIRMRSRRFAKHLLLPSAGIVLLCLIVSRMSGLAITLGAAWFLCGAVLYWRSYSSSNV